MRIGIGTLLLVWLGSASCNIEQLESEVGDPTSTPYSISAVLDVDSLPKITLNYNLTVRNSNPQYTLARHLLSNVQIRLNPPGGTVLSFERQTNAVPGDLTLPISFFYKGNRLLNFEPQKIYTLSLAMEDGLRDSMLSTPPRFLPNRTIDSVIVTNTMLSNHYTGYLPKRVVRTFIHLDREVNPGLRYFFVRFDFGHSLYPDFTGAPHYRFNTNLPLDESFIPYDIISEIDGKNDDFFQFPYKVFGFIWETGRDLDLEIRALLPDFLEQEPGYGVLPPPKLYLMETDAGTYEYLRKVNLQVNTKMVPFTEPVLVKSGFSRFFGVFGFYKTTIRHTYHEVPYDRP